VKPSVNPCESASRLSPFDFIVHDDYGTATSDWKWVKIDGR